MINWEDYQSWSSYSYTISFPRTLSTILWLFGIWSKLERWKSLISGCLVSSPQIKKIVILKCHLLFLYTTTNYFLIGLWHVTKSGLCKTTGDDQLSGWTEKLQSTSQSQTWHQKRSWSLFGGLLLVWSTIAFWILAKPLHLRSMLSKLMMCTENCSACIRHWSTERAQFFSMTMPDRMAHNQHFKSWMNWVTKFHLICHVYVTCCQLTTTSSSILITFCRVHASTISRMQKMLSKSLPNPEEWIFYGFRNKQTYFLLAKMCWL